MNTHGRIASISAATRLPLALVCVLLFFSRASQTLSKRSRLADGFSFAAYGESRPMMYLPFQGGSIGAQQAARRDVWARHAREGRREVVKREVKMMFDPVTDDLIRSSCRSRASRKS